MQYSLYYSLILYFSSLTVSAQIIQGTVIDTDSSEPVPFATVYLANTQIGYISEVDGTYSLEKVTPGRYDLTVSCMGYDIWSKPLTITEQETLTIDIRLTPKVVALQEIEVLPDTSDRSLNLPEFIRNFIGEVSNGKKCRIANLNALHLYFDAPNRTLFAHASKPLKVENEALGYDVYYDLAEFSLDYKREKLLVFGIPRFSPHEKIKRKHLKAREKTYKGSLFHFAKLLVGSMEDFEENFIVQENFLIKNRERPEQKYLDKKLKKFRSTTSGSLSISDSLIFYSRLNKLPSYVDSLGKVLSRNEFFTSDHQIKTGRYNIIHKKSLEEPNYPQAIIRKRRQRPLSTITATKPLTVYQNGYIEGMKEALVQGYWAWSEKIANLLPLSYSPSP